MALRVVAFQQNASDDESDDTTSADTTSADTTRRVEQAVEWIVDDSSFALRD